MSRLLLGAALLCSLLLPALVVIACDDNGGASADATAVATPAPSPAPSPTPEPELESQIGDRGGLPEADPVDLAARYGLTDGMAARSKPFTGVPPAGSRREFTIQRISGAAFSGAAPPQNVTISATLAAIGERAYIYVDDALGFDPAGAQQAASDFDSVVWPAVTSIFGEPHTPGVDGDPRIIVLQADLGGAVGGYFSGDDGYLKSVRPASNEAEMVYLDRSLRLGSPSFTVVVAHELQHLVHAHNDGGEESWINEGLSETATGLVGGQISSIDIFATRPQTQLNAWSTGDSGSHYGAGASFTRYLADRFGGDAHLGAISRADGDGAAGIDEYLAAVDPSLTFREVFSDWITANVLNRVEGRFGNPSEPVSVQVQHELAPGLPYEGLASQFGARYFDLGALGPGEHVVSFNGVAMIPALPDAAVERGPALWANAGDDINTRLTRALDLTGTTSPLLTFKTWFDIETWYDWGYVAVSTDGGETWQAIGGEHTRSDDPVQVAYGPGYSGKSGEGAQPVWVDERVDLSPFAGQEILLRFEYVTDGASHGEGWVIDDVSVSEGVFSDLTSQDPGWDREGWVRLARELEQDWVVRLIGERDNGEPVVLDAAVIDGRGELRFSADGLRNVVLAVAGVTEGTRREAPFTVELLAP